MKIIAWRVNKKGEVENILDKKMWLNWIFIYGSQSMAAVAIDPVSGFGKVVSDLAWGPGQILVKVVGCAFIYYVLKWANEAFQMGSLNSILRLLTILIAVWMVLSDVGNKINSFLRGQF